MSVSVSDFIDCASGLANADTEIGLRSAVSRAYYGAYHDCASFEATLPHLGDCPEEQKGMHNQLCWRLSKPHMAVARETKLTSIRRGVLLRKFHADRVAADYDLDWTMTTEQAAQAVVDARTIVSIR